MHTQHILLRVAFAYLEVSNAEQFSLRLCSEAYNVSVLVRVLPVRGEQRVQLCVRRA
jgi:hypothetical protein